MLEHPDDICVQLAGMRLLAGLAQPTGPLATEALCQPITIETALKTMQMFIDNPDIVCAFADMIIGLMNDKNQAPQIATMLAQEGILVVLQETLEKHKANMLVTSKVNAALASLKPYFRRLTVMVLGLILMGQ